ncbi:hypothetical protein HPB48_003550 [Haemaphysalis longicornis]|uniref:Pseudouridine synthase RsuA/RluA-like domain-containing protein n=1 Tax=Haemaphysalis longicornis TaxID=44386 RepID=A0A9J6FC21_HAELO|nr:hypothetical protein HPB48_003550 [Haemaphysalis longicornis]
MVTDSGDGPSRAVVTAVERTDEGRAAEIVRGGGDGAIRVLHRSAHFLVVEKPADLVINTQKTLEHPVTVETLLRRQLPELVDPAVQHGFRFCHRLDFATSGVLCLALTRRAASAAQVVAKRVRQSSSTRYPRSPASKAECGGELKEAFGPPLRPARKCYVALLEGHVPLAPNNGIEVDLAVGEDSRDGHQHKMCTANEDHCVSPREARTRVLLLRRGYFHARPASQVALSLLTGRRHQLRVHCAALGHPVVGDTTYGGADAVQHDRMYLHAWALRLPTHLEAINVDTGGEHPFCRLPAWRDCGPGDDAVGSDGSDLVTVDRVFEQFECPGLFLPWRMFVRPLQADQIEERA